MESTSFLTNIRVEDLATLSANCLCDGHTGYSLGGSVEGRNSQILVYGEYTICNGAENGLQKPPVLIGFHLEIDLTA
jgi:hypothetical protein